MSQSLTMMIVITVAQEHTNHPRSFHLSPAITQLCIIALAAAATSGAQAGSNALSVFGVMAQIASSLGN